MQEKSLVRFWGGKETARLPHLSGTTKEYNTTSDKVHEMTYKYDISQNGQRIDTFPKGVLDTKKTIDYFGRLKNDNRVKQGAIEIVYFRYVTDFKISYLESNIIIKNYHKLKALLMIDATIFVCETDLAYGIGRMLQTLHEIANPKHKIAIVKSESELENVIKTV
ncbi:MAG: hypothetical protein JRJ43_04215 [Deltaproteobacteria bacterium]|nr:hypothetical protein [Deltaproteobacteria bacterium]MBW1718756.1 hypothetical protein [Deltaproteobacteria bacterium]MBW1932340.1 hypothetical protein [Deltaproteobacteria bacterium]MBW1963965.1 hypothetical protein [Deltaproteobacteria bacterium]MBW2079538.1 hypothetical protein [Deltaproteobacteria bacterium]